MCNRILVYHAERCARVYQSRPRQGIGYGLVLGEKQFLQLLWHSQFDAKQEPLLGQDNGPRNQRLEVNANCGHGSVQSAAPGCSAPRPAAPPA